MTAFRLLLRPQVPGLFSVCGGPCWKSLAQAVALIAVLTLAIPSANAQWTTQTISLRPGWNAVFVEVQPEPRGCDTVFANFPVQSVWRWNRRFDPVQFIQDPETLVPGQAEWLAWFPSNAVGRAALNLHVLLGGYPYLIQVAGNAQPFAWVVRGKPVLRPIDWLSDSLNFAGFSVDAQTGPTFAAFFGGSAAHNQQLAHRLNATGTWQAVTDPATTRLQPGEAFWIKTLGPSDYQGPLLVMPEQRQGLEYGRILTEQTLTIRNRSSTARTVTVRQLPSSSAPDGQLPVYAGEVPLSYFHMNLSAGQYGWKPVQAPLTHTNLAPGEDWAIRFEVRRADMNAFTPPNGVTDVLYQSLLEITDTAGSRCVVPVTANGLQSFTRRVGLMRASLAGANALPHPRTGLWVGSAVIQKVNQPASASAPNTPAATATEFQFRLIVHVDQTGQAQLLQKVLQMWKKGTTRPDPNNPGVQIIDQPGRFVLLTDESLVKNYTGAALRDGQAVGRRISSAAFSFKTPITLTGAGEFGASTISCVVPLDYDDPINPFKHKYHPDHNNLDERYEVKLSEGLESFTVIRDIQMEFQSSDPEGLALAGWGDNQLGGVYRETIVGLHRNTLRLEGIFRLHHASRVPVLNDGM